MKEDNHCPNCFICYIFGVLVPGEVYKEAQWRSFLALTFYR